MKKLLKNKEGITLIALVITIVILLILAGVSINLILGENGLISRAKEAKEQQEIAGYAEILEMELSNAQQDKYLEKTQKSILEIVKESIEKNEKFKEAQISDIVDGKLLVKTKENYNFEVTDEEIKNLKDVSDYEYVNFY